MVLVVVFFFTSQLTKANILYAINIFACVIIIIIIIKTILLLSLLLNYWHFFFANNEKKSSAITIRFFILKLETGSSA